MLFTLNTHPTCISMTFFIHLFSQKLFASKQNFVHKSFGFCVCECVPGVCSPWNLISSCTAQCTLTHRNARKLESYSSLGFAHGLMMKLTNCCNQFSYELFSLGTFLEVPFVNHAIKSFFEVIKSFIFWFNVSLWCNKSAHTPREEKQNEPQQTTEQSTSSRTQSHAYAAQSSCYKTMN